jgi:hypothetical protein
MRKSPPAERGQRFAGAIKAAQNRAAVERLNAGAVLSPRHVLLQLLLD